MSAVSPLLKQTIKEIQSLPSLSSFLLAGGTNLALRYNHRESQDIDLFCHDTIGVEHFNSIEQEAIEFFGVENITGIQYPAGIEKDQFIFLRFFVTKTPDFTIKVEIIQNMKMMDDVEVIDDIRLVSDKDIGMFKLISGSSRAARKDIYDLDFITNHISLTELMENLKQKQKKFNIKEDRNIFDLDDDESPLDNPKLLLKFEGNITQNTIKPIHSNDQIIIVEGSKSWIEARISWRMKVRKLFGDWNINHDWHSN
jgi:hypothetical protein